VAIFEVYLSANLFTLPVALLAQGVSPNEVRLGEIARKGLNQVENRNLGHPVYGIAPRKSRQYFIE
jgi:hypothetical protein